jgi:hypothetical protein
MKFIVYETTNLVNGKKYRGAHCCSHDYCCYLGSGILFKKALVKYGAASFERKVLRECNSVDEMFSAEAELVTPEWVADENTYNLKVGGEGGWDFVNRAGLRWSEFKKAAHSVEMKKKRAAGLWGPKSPPTKGKSFTHTETSRKKISQNNGSRLDAKTLAQRLEDLDRSGYPKRGSIKMLSEKWNVSHTQVRRFAESQSS